jgi:hypothetical protein
MELSSARKVPSRCSPLGLRGQTIASKAPDRPEASWEEEDVQDGPPRSRRRPEHASLFSFS